MRNLLCCHSERVSVTIESKPTTNSTDFDPIFPDLRDLPEYGVSSEYFTEMLLSYVFVPSMVDYGRLSNNRSSHMQS